jgi:D-alanyl-D-alanine carboxypeptidase (penicillin-binding protein 5/6)
VGELVPPKSAVPTTSRPGASPSAGGLAGGGSSAGPVAGAAVRSGSSGMGIALGISAGVLALLAAGVFLVNRRWPLPDLMRRRSRP